MKPNELAVAELTGDDQLASIAKERLNSPTATVSMAGSRLLDRLASSGRAADLTRAGEAAAGTRFPERGAAWLHRAVDLGDVQAAYGLAMAIREGR